MSFHDALRPTFMPEEPKICGMKRKLYSEMLDWKAKWAGQYALMIEGARRVGHLINGDDFGIIFTNQCIRSA